MTQNITLDTPLVISPATAAVTTDNVTITYVAENYGWDYDPTQPGGGRASPGRPLSVEVVVMLNNDPYQERRLVAWDGDAYLAVRGTWTDADLSARIKEILEQN